MQQVRHVATPAEQAKGPPEPQGASPLLDGLSQLAVDPGGESLFSDALLESAEAALTEAVQAGGGRWVERTLR